MASRVGKVVSKMWKFSSAGRSSTPASRSAASSVAGDRSIPGFSSPYASALPPHQTRFGSRRSLQFSAGPGDVRCVTSMIPRHNATATARLVSRLSGDLCPDLEVITSADRPAFRKWIHDLFVAADGRLARYVSPI